MNVQDLGRRQSPPAAVPPSRSQPWIVVGLAAQALASFLVGIGRDGVWFDEMATLVFTFTDGGWSRAVATAIEHHNHPPLYYSLVWVWGTLLGTSDALLRLPSALFMMACIPLLYKMARDAAGPWAGLFACQFFIFSPVAIRFAQEARPYALYCLLSLASLRLLISILTSDEATGAQRRQYAAYGVVLLAACATHPYAVFVASAHALVVALFGRGRRVAFATTWLAVLCLAWPLASRFATGSSRMTRFMHDPGANQLWTDPGVSDVLGLFPWLAFGPPTLWSRIAAAASGLLFLALLALFLARARSTRRRSRTWLHLAATGVYAGATVLLPGLVSLLYSNIYVPRYFVAALPAVVLVGVSGVYLGFPRRLAAHAACVCVLALVVPASLHHRRTPQHVQWREAIAFVAADARKDDHVLLDGGPVLGDWSYMDAYWRRYARGEPAAPESAWIWSRKEPLGRRLRLRSEVVRGLGSQMHGRLWILAAPEYRPPGYPPALQEVLSRYEVGLVASFKGIAVYEGARRPGPGRDS